MTKVKIEVRDRTFEYRRAKEFYAHTRVYFGHEGENVLENFGNRACRPRDLYKTYLPDVAEALGLPRTTKFRWSQKAGCSCGCSPGFICNEDSKRDVWVTLSADAPVVDEADKEGLLEAAWRKSQLVNSL